MRYTEWYEVYSRQLKDKFMLIGKFDTEQEAVDAMNKAASRSSFPGAWKVTRVSEVTIAAQSKA